LKLVSRTAATLHTEPIYSRLQFACYLLNDRIQHLAEEHGLDLIGIAKAEPGEYNHQLRGWLEKGYEGEMAYMRNNVEKREDPRNLEPWAKSIICAAVNYNADAPYSTDPRPSDQGWIARYAWGDDYHDTFKKTLFRFADAIREEVGEDVELKVCLDTAPILDRAYAAYSGIGWLGKNTCIIHRKLGSFIFLAEIVTSLELEPTPAETDHCGTCTACIDACPTDAILEPYVLDSRRCIYYLTIELRDNIPEEFREEVGTHIFGCDICQDVCPWNRKSPRTERPEYQPRPGSVAPPIKELLEMSEENYRQRFRKSPVKRTKYSGVLRNACVAAGNTGEVSLIPSLRKAATVSPFVAEHAEWAIAKLETNSHQTS
jgi:epoxyqueuosine reductase